MIVYITTNIINGKKYIGKDVRNSNSYIGSGKILKNAINKYGKKNFLKEILAHTNNKKHLEELEKYFINYYNATNSELFYNLHEGGSGGLTSDQTSKKKPIYQYSLKKELISKWDSAGDAANSLSIERTKIVTSLDSGKQYKGFLWGRDSKYLVERKLPTYNRKRVIQKNLKGDVLRVFDSMKEASKYVGYNKSTIYDTINGKIKNHPFIWDME